MKLLWVEKELCWSMYDWPGDKPVWVNGQKKCEEIETLQIQVEELKPSYNRQIKEVQKSKDLLMTECFGPVRES